MQRVWHVTTPSGTSHVHLHLHLHPHPHTYTYTYTPTPTHLHLHTYTYTPIPTPTPTTTPTPTPTPTPTTTTTTTTTTILPIASLRFLSRKMTHLIERIIPHLGGGFELHHFVVPIPRNPAQLGQDTSLTWRPGSGGYSADDCYFWQI